MNSGRNTRLKSSFDSVNKSEDVTQHMQGPVVYKNLERMSSSLTSAFNVWIFSGTSGTFIWISFWAFSFGLVQSLGPIPPLGIICQIVRFSSTSSQICWIEMSGDVSPCCFWNQAINLSDPVRSICFSSGGWFRKPTKDN